MSSRLLFQSLRSRPTGFGVKHQGLLRGDGAGAATIVPHYGRNRAWAIGGAALMATSAVALAVPSTECEATTPSTTTGELNNIHHHHHGANTSFQVIAALDMHEEVQRVRMAQLLHDLYELAKGKSGGEEEAEPQKYATTLGNKTADGKLKRYSTVRRMWKFVNKTMEQTTVPTPNPDAISIDPSVFENLTPTKAHDLIHQIEKGALLSADSVLDLLYSAERALLKEETVIDFTDEDYDLPNFTKVTVVGDLHGSVKSLQHVLTVVGDFVSHKDHAIVFDGDFVDRGDNSLGVLLILLLLKLAYPKNVFLLRGNHEDVLVASAYGFQHELVGKYGSEEADDIWDGVNSAFCALPLCIVTDTAVILHGGIPTANFDLDQIRDITPNLRKRMKSLVEPKNELEELVQGIVWSDPSHEDGIAFNSTRSVGSYFGPDVARDFLERHSSKYLVRAHQPIPGGSDVIDCGADRYIVTVFSQPNYPNGVGNNLGALVHLTKDGGIETMQFSRQAEIATSLVCSQDDDEHYMDTLRTLICRFKNKLERSFREEAPGGKMSTSQWASVMSNALELPQVPWMVLCADLAPISEDGNEVDWNDFLELYEATIFDAPTPCEDNVSMEVLHANQDMIMTTFKFLDRDGNGTIDKDDFKAGITLLNKRLNKSKQMRDPDALFDQIDRDGHGEIGLSELREMFELMSSQGEKTAAAH